MSFLERLPGSLVMGPMTKGSNLPYRQLCAELGATILVSEMVVARRLKQRRRSEFALIRRAPEEPCFGVQLAGNKPEELGWAAALVEARGAEFVDLNLGCPIDHFTRMGLGAALGRQVSRVRRIVETMKLAVTVPVTVKIRLGWDAQHRNYLDLARAIQDGGASALTVHGRTREDRYRRPADWETIGEIAHAVSLPVIGNGDILFGHQVAPYLAASGCAAAMTARGALIKPWLFREVSTAYDDISAETRLEIYRRYVELATAHWGARRPRLEERDTTDPPDAPAEVTAPALDEHGRTRVRDFLRWHVGFWVRYAPQRPDGTWPTMQQRESTFVPRSDLEALLARSDDAALDYITDGLLEGRDLQSPPAIGSTATESEIVEAG